MNKEKINKIVLSIIIALICVVLIATILVQFKTVEETDITAIETMREAELRTSLSEWKSKYNYEIVMGDVENGVWRNYI